jgi:hypothetical protein
MICANSGQYWLSGSGEEVENVKFNHLISHVTSFSIG